MADENKKPWDWKQVSTGAGGSILALFLLQDRGIELINKKNEATNQVVIEKTIANAQRISALEASVKDLNLKIDTGFNGLHKQLQEDIRSIQEIVREGSKDRYTKTDHLTYAESINSRIKFLEYQLQECKNKK